MATANIVTEAPGDSKSSARVSRLERNYFALPPEPASPGPSSFSPETPLTPLAGYSEGYWTALSNLDLTALRNAAQSEPEIGFAEGLALLAGGEHERAEGVFVVTSRQATDVNVAVASQIMLAKSLLYRRKWTTLRDLSISSGLPFADRASTAELEKWGKAFAGVDEQTATLPEKPVSLQLGITAVGTPTVRVRINGKEYDFWLDTGSSMTVLSSRVAADARVPIVSPDTLNIGTFQGVAPVRPAIVKRLEIGPIVFGNTPAIVMDAGLMRIKSTAEGVTGAGLRVDGIIGWDIIRQLDITMDYEEETITIEQPARAGTNGTAFQNLVWLGKPLVQVTTTSGGTFHFTLDTGAQATFLNAAILERMGVVTETRGGRVFGFNKTGGKTERVIPALTLGIAGVSFRLERVIVYGPSLTSLINTDGILGSDIARFGKIRIDATNGVFSVGDKER
ncbi:MAG TPA: aspartyl protease family protein [Gemmatimonadaceae bacterium]|nr:aspartyl protease family protein [Gemmatimonadaceae bacterium]